MKSCLLSELNFWWKKVWIWWSVHWCIFLTRSYMPLKSEVKESTQQTVFLTVRLLPTRLSPSLRNLEVPIPEASRSTLYAQFLWVFNRLHRSGVQLRDSDLWAQTLHWSFSFSSSLCYVNEQVLEPSTCLKWHQHFSLEFMENRHL